MVGKKFCHGDKINWKNFLWKYNFTVNFACFKNNMMFTLWIFYRLFKCLLMDNLTFENNRYLFDLYDSVFINHKQK